MIPPWRSDFSQFQLNCAKALSALIVIVFLSPHIHYHFFYKKEQMDFGEFEVQVEAFYEEYDPPKMKHYYKSDTQKWKSDKNQDERKTERKKTASRPFPFDPNTASFKELTSLGLSKKVANTLINFRKKGGKFYKKTDLKKVYGLDEEDYDRLEGYIKISSK